MSARHKLKVLLVAPAHPLVGGQSIQAKRLLEKLEAEDGLDVGFLAVNPSFFPSLQKVRILRTILTTFRYLIGLLAKVPKYDLVHVFSASFSSFLLAPVPAILVSKLFRKKVLLNYRSGFAEEHLRDWPRTSLPMIRICDLVVTPSNYLVDVFRQFDIEATSVYNFVEAEDYESEPRESLRPSFLSNRNFEGLYNVSCTIDAFARILEVRPDATMKVAGAGPLGARLREQAKELPAGSIEFVGQVSQDEMRKLYSEADIYLNSPDVDNMPNSILEAFASGTAVVSTDAGGIPYIVEHEKNGLLVDKGDDKSLAEEALRLLNDPALANKLIEGGRKELTKYEWDSVRDDWLRVYGSI